MVRLRTRRVQCPAREPGAPDGAFEVIAQIDADAGRGPSRSLRREVDFSGAFQDPVDVVAELVAVVDHGGTVPGVQRMQALTIQQRLRSRSGVDEAVETPAPVYDADFEEHAVRGVRFLQVKEALFGGAVAVWAEEHFPGERLRARERVHVEKQSVVDSRRR